MKRQTNLWLLLIVAVCAASLWVGRGAENPFRQPDPVRQATRSTGPAGEPDAPPVHLAILNGAGQGGLARQISGLVTRVGCVVESVGNAPAGQYPGSLLINRRLDPERARALAAQLGGIRLLTEWDERSTEDAVLLLGADHALVLTALDP